MGKEDRKTERTMICVSQKRCVIGEGPVWNAKEGRLYFVNGLGNEICVLDLDTLELTVRKVAVSVAAMAFDHDNRMIVSRPDGVFYLNPDDTAEALYDTEKYHIQYANDMKVGPDGRIYVGTQCERRLGISDKIDGKLYSIDKDGEVRVLLDHMILSNGLEWSIDEKRFYHTDNMTGFLREYEFDRDSGDIAYTGREIEVPGLDGFTINREDCLMVTSSGGGCVWVIDTGTLKVREKIPVPTSTPASCAYAGNHMEYLAVVTASYEQDLNKNPNGGFTYLYRDAAGGRLPYLFG